MITTLLDLLYPNLCCICGNTLTEGENHFCAICEIALPKTRFENHVSNPVYQSLAARCGVKFATSYLFFKKNAPVQILLHHLKYKGAKDIGNQLGKMLGDSLAQIQKNQFWNCIVPVPLHPARQLERGYNQSSEIAKGLSTVLNIPTFENVLIRSHYNVSQTGKHRGERWKNVASVFELNNAHQITQQNVLLIDDVFTTGATIESCCMKIWEAKPLNISAATIAYADY